MTVVDMHVHTNVGSPDSDLTPGQLIEEAKRRELDAVCITEHGPPWRKEEVERLTREHGILLIRGMEVQTDLGHIIVFGLPGYTSGILRAEGLRRATDEVGGFMILAHPFRTNFDFKKDKMNIEQAVTLSVLSLVDGLEVANGYCTEVENLFALEVAGRLGMKGTGGSDAHSMGDVGRFVTIFEGEVNSEESFIRELKRGRFYPARRLHSGELVPFGKAI